MNKMNTKTILAMGITGCILIVILGGCSKSMTPSDSVPSAQSGITVDGSIAHLLISWNEVEGATSYTVYDTKDGTIPTSTNYFKTYSVTTNSLRLSEVSLGVTYTFAVTATNDIGESGFSSLSTGATLVPTNPGATATTGKIRITWDAVTGAASYFIYDTKDGTVPTTTNYFKYYSVSKDSLSLTGVTAGSPYQFVVSAVDSDGNEGGLSAIASVTAQ